MIFVHANVFMYAVGRPHALKAPAREFFIESHRKSVPLHTSAEVLQEMAHAYFPVARSHTFDAAMSLIVRFAVDVWPLEAADIALARRLHEWRPALSARDLCYLASCRMRGVREIRTFDRALREAAAAPE